MKLPSVYPLTIPSSHSTMRMIAIVSSMVFSLRAKLLGALCDVILQQRLCRLSGPGVKIFTRRVMLFVFAAIGLASPSYGQSADPAQPTDSTSTGKQIVLFLTGAATGLGAHEAGHVIADLAYG